MKRNIIDFFKKNKISTDYIRLIGSDGPPSNTGWKGGLIRLLEEELERPLQRSICLLHLNELPFKRFLASYGYGSYGGKTVRGILGKLIQEEMHSLPVLRTEALLSTSLLPLEEFIPNHQKGIDSLRSDQEVFFAICQALIKGDFGSFSFERKAGPVSNTRWMVTAHRILLVYATCEEPEKVPHLIDIVHYILRVYAPMYFRIKSEPDFKSGSKHFFEMVDRSRYLQGKQLEAVQESLLENSYFSHPEQVLVAMFCDPDHKTEALGLIRRARHLAQEGGSEKIRIFKKPTVINWAANDYTELADFYTSSANLLEPPLFRGILDEDLDSYEVAKYPNHTQAVERNIKYASREAKVVCDQEMRVGGQLVRAKAVNNRRKPK